MTSLLLVTIILCIINVYATDLDDIIKRLNHLESRERNYIMKLHSHEKRIRELEGQIVVKNAAISELNERLSMLEDDKNRDTGDIEKHSQGTDETSQTKDERKWNETARPGDRSSHSHTCKRFLEDPEVGVAFHAAMGENKEYEHFGSQQPIVFDVVNLNIGNAYRSNRGIFIAPFNGVYVFSASVLSYRDPKPEIYAAIAKNGTPLASIYGHGDNGRHDQGSVTLTAQLSIDDEITVEILMNNASFWGGLYTTFTGFSLMQV